MGRVTASVPVECGALHSCLTIFMAMLVDGPSAQTYDTRTMLIGGRPPEPPHSGLPAGRNAHSTGEQEADTCASWW
jgi:hypothetical protein